MKYLLKQAILPAIYIIFCAFTAIGILCIEENLVVLKIILLILNLGLYLFLACVISFKEGQEAYKVLLNNDAERRIIVQTGEDRKLKIQQEYAPWKGFVSGIIVCAPLIILMIIHTILYFATNGSANGAGAISWFVYAMISGLTKPDLAVAFTQWHFYFTLVTIPIISISMGVPYVLGAKKIEHQQQMIKEKHKKIYGEQ